MEDIQKPASQKGSKKVLIGGALVVVVGLIVGSFVYQQTAVKDAKAENTALKEQVEKLEDRTVKLEKPEKALEKEIDKSKYQAVFLVGGQVYFGKLTVMSRDNFKIDDIFYLVESGNQLVKLGKEKHGPEDTMIIERKNVSFWENIKSDGEVAKTIADYNKTHKD